MIVDNVRGRYYIVINPLETTGPQYWVQSPVKFTVRFPSDCNISYLNITTQSDPISGHISDQELLHPKLEYIQLD